MESTAEGKQIAMDRAKTKDDMVLVSDGSFLMGSDKKTDRNAYVTELPQRMVHLDVFEIGKYQVTNLQYLKFVLATGRPPLIDWRYDGGNFQKRWPTIRSCTSIGTTPRPIVGGPASGSRLKRNGKKSGAWHRWPY